MLLLLYKVFQIIIYNKIIVFETLLFAKKLVDNINILKDNINFVYKIFVHFLERKQYNRAAIITIFFA